MQHESGTRKIHEKAMKHETALLRKSGRLRAMFELVQASMLDVYLSFLITTGIGRSPRDVLEIFNRLILLAKQFDAFRKRIRRLQDAPVKSEHVSDLLKQQPADVFQTGATEILQCEVYFRLQVVSSHSITRPCYISRT